MSTKNTNLAAVRTQLQKAFETFKKSDRPNIFADSIEALMQAEIRRIHACANACDDAWKLSQELHKPEPVAVFEFDTENQLERFKDGSLYEKSSADSTVWADFRDFRSDRIGYDEPLTSGMRKFFDESGPEEPTKYRITQRSKFYGPLTTESWAREDAPGQRPLEFESREAAEAWINECESDRYDLSHNESGRPDHIITPCE